MKDESMTSVEDLVKAIPDRVGGLLNAVDLPAAGDLAGACRTLLARCRARDASAVVRQAVANLHRSASDDADWAFRAPAAPSDALDEAAEELLADTFTTAGVTARQPRRADGHLDWLHCGPRSDAEWAFSLNRHRYFADLLRAWKETGNVRYAACIARHVLDWVLALPRPASLDDSKPVWLAWRVLEIGLRLSGPWPLAFHMLRDCEGFPDAARLAMLLSVAEQADFLRHNHGWHPNHLLMELTGLAMAGASWPQLAAAGEWIDYAIGVMRPQTAAQFYGDGAQMELSCGYHLVSLGHLELFAQTVEGLAGRAMGEDYHAATERMWNYLACVQRPDGRYMANNDSSSHDARKQVLAAAERFGRDDWRHIATLGRQGRPPAGPPSRYFPYAGHLVMRSGWGPRDHWGFFDCGPLGVSGHQHRDKLHFGCFVGGREILADSGVYWYRWDIWRQYFLGSHGHNTILVDGRGQGDDIETVAEPLQTWAAVTDELDFACGTFDAGYLALEGRAAHTRAVCYVRGGCWVIVDRIATDRPRTIQPLWHFHPDCTVVRDAADVLTADAGKGNLRIVPVAGFPWRVDLVAGATDGDTNRYRMWKADLVRGPDDVTIQGWFSPEYNTKLPATCAVYRAAIDGDATFAWVLAPVTCGLAEPLTVEALRMDGGVVHLSMGGGGQALEVALSLDGPRELALSDGSTRRTQCLVRRSGAPAASA